jgi:predicted HD phosphohydrolase
MAPEDEALQIAGLVHDIGQAVGHAQDHEQVAAIALYPLLGPRIADLVRLHVDAKRYLVATEPDYQARLSDISQAGLNFQGGAMTDSEVATFVANPHSLDAVRLRRCDDGAKQAGLVVSGLSTWLTSLRRVAKS